jgi:hypothetical protein
MINTLIIHTPPTVLSRRHLSEIGVSESRHGGRYPLHHVSSPSESSLSITYKSKFIHAPPRLSHASCITHTHTHTHTHTTRYNRAPHQVRTWQSESTIGSRKTPHIRTSLSRVVPAHPCSSLTVCDLNQPLPLLYSSPPLLLPTNVHLGRRSSKKDSVGEPAEGLRKPAEGAEGSLAPDPPRSLLRLCSSSSSSSSSLTHWLPA